MRDNWDQFVKHGVEIFGVNPGSAKSHARFREQHRFPFPLLVDAGRKAAKLYGANGIVNRRTVYGINKDGRIAFAERGQPAPAKILAAIEKAKQE